MQKEKLGGRLRLILAAALILGIFFRLYNIDHKAFWFDEAVTAHLMSGYTNWQMRELYLHLQAKGSGSMPVEEFISYDGPRPERGFSDAVSVLLSEDAGHPILYFIAAYHWTRTLQPIFGLVTSIRSLSTIFSIAQLPLMWWLATQLFKSRRTAAYSVILLALSPFHILYAQDARSYSLWAALVLASSSALLYALTSSSAIPWTLYGLTVAAGINAHMFFPLTIAAHVSYTACTVGRKALKPMFLSLVGAGILCMPWFWILSGYSEVLFINTAWTGQRTNIITLLAWLGSGASSIFIDYDIGGYPLEKLPYLLPPVIAAIALAIYSISFIMRSEERNPRLFLTLLLTWSLLPLLLLDLVMGGMRSCVPRYLTPLLLGIGMSAAYMLSEKTRDGSKAWVALIIVILSSAIISDAFASQQEVWWNKYLTIDFPKIFAKINASDKPLIISDANYGLLWSLSWGLKPDARIMVVAEETPRMPLSGHTIFLYLPSDKLRDRLDSKYAVSPVTGCHGLWSLTEKES